MRIEQKTLNKIFSHSENQEMEYYISSKIWEKQIFNFIYHSHPVNLSFHFNITHI